MTLLFKNIPSCVRRMSINQELDISRNIHPHTNLKFLVLWYSPLRTTNRIGWLVGCEIDGRSVGIGNLVAGRTNMGTRSRGAGQPTAPTGEYKVVGVVHRLKNPACEG